MDEDAEQILTALADPIDWVRHSYNEGEVWKGESKHGSYSIGAPSWLDTADATTYMGVWRLNIAPNGALAFEMVPVKSLEHAKQLCRHHALTGDTTEIYAIRDAALAECRMFPIHEHLWKAEYLLEKPFHKHQTPWLDFQPRALDALVISASGQRGSYAVRFESDRRWVARFTPDHGKGEERCFATRLVAEIACAYHSHTGKWRGILNQKHIAFTGWGRVWRHLLYLFGRG